MSENGRNAVDIVRSVAPEGVVLLENNGILPLSENQKKIALYGAGALLTMKGGTGSGDVDVEHVVNILEALETEGFTITTKDWLNDYQRRHEEGEDRRYAQMDRELEQTGDPLMSIFLRNPQVLVDGADIEPVDEKITDEVAVYVISRISGECADREMKEGDYLLTKAEYRQIKAIAANYQDVIVVLNTGGVIDTNFYREIEGISAMLQISQAGMACGMVLADLLTGKAVPSGHLTATWAKQYADYPASKTFCDNSSNDKTYDEGIFVGYRYFDSFQIEPAYAFGYGKSYTEFAWDFQGMEVKDEKISVEVKVTNCGKCYPGKEVIQAYVSAPQGELVKPYQELRAFAKTKLLAPGESEVLTLQWGVREMASYSEAWAAYILEAGRYLIRIGNSSRNTQPVAAVRLGWDVITTRLENKLAVRQELPEIRPEKCADTEGIPVLMEIDLNAEELHTEVISYEESEESSQGIKSGENTSWSYLDVKNGKASVEELLGQLSAEETVALCVGAGAIGNGAVIDGTSIKVPGAGGETTSMLLRKWGVPAAVLADGPAGLRLMRKYQVRNADNSVVVPPNGFLALTGFERFAGKPPVEPDCHYIEQNTTAVPIGSMMAQTWNPQMFCEIGNLVSGEMKKYGVNIWLAPAMNIHRDPLCGRNFEYYSEDPLVTGVCAAEMTKAIQSTKGCGVAVKHFAANSQETNRFDENSVVSERALREIYLRGFERVIKEADPTMLMSSYNLINGTHTANSKELLTDILRKEWGFKGTVVTDWGTTKNGMRAGWGGKSRSFPGVCMSSGNDLIMPGNPKDREEIADALESGTLSMAELRKCARNIIKLLIRLDIEK